MGHALVVQILCHTSGAIAAHHGFGSVVIEDAHGEIGIGTCGSTDKDQSVTANAEVGTAPFDGCCRWVGNTM